MAAALPPRVTIPPEERAKIAERNRKLRGLIDFMKALPDDPKPEEINNVAMLATAIKQSEPTSK